MKLWIGFIFLFFLSIQASQAKDTWIQVVGIYPRWPSQNYYGFYQSAEDFLNSCERSARKPNCHLFINSDPQKSRDPESVAKLRLEPNEGAPTLKRVLKFIEKKITQAKNGDTLIISLVSHGNFHEEKGASCIGIGGGEPEGDLDEICDTHLISLIKNTAPGVKVFINAEACYSGGFTKVVKAGACSLTTSNQSSPSFEGLPSLWRQLKNKDSQSLNSFNLPITSGNDTFLSSQSIARSLCKNVRAKLKMNEESNSVLLRLGQIREIHDTPPGADFYVDMAGFSKDLVKFSNFFHNLSCEKMKLPGFLCDIQKKISPMPPNTMKEIKSLEQFLPRYRGLGNEIQTLTKAKMGNWPKEIEDSVDRIVTYGANVQEQEDKWPKEQLAEIRQLVIELVEARNRLVKKRLAAWAQIQASLRELQSQNSFQDWMTIHSCLAPPDEDEGNSLTNFNANDYFKAKECEASIRF